jgi:hypothetical protein
VTWQERNHRHIVRALDRVYAAIARTGADAAPPRRSPARRSRAAPAARGGAAADPPMALERLTAVLRLTRFEEDVLLLCAGVELQARFAGACAAAHGDAGPAWPTFSLALAMLPAPHWSAISRDRPLRYWRLIEAGPGDGLVRSPLRIDERILHYLAGVPCMDERLDAVIRPAAAPAAPPADTHVRAAEAAARYWTGAAEAGGLKPLLLIGRPGSDASTVMHELCRMTGIHAYTVHATDIPAHAAERAQLARLWNREALLMGAGLFIQTAGVDSPEAARAAAAFLSDLVVPAAVEVHDGSAFEGLEGFRLHLRGLARPERRALWIEGLGPLGRTLDGDLDRIVDHFRFDAASIRLASGAVVDAAAVRGEAAAGRLAWDICRAHARRSLEGLAARIDARTGWRDLVLPDLQVETLRQITAHVRRRAVVHERWGFAGRYARGLGVTALFAGPSGTGKTLAAEVIATDLEMDLFQIDLASVVSKYIGETEKNLRRVFDAAEESGAVLLFDEADALFGKRSEVRDSHDRYANLEISYLLQRMESYNGLAVLTTNMKHALDGAFLRRLRFVVQFPFPDAPQRRRIWEGVFPAETPLDGLDYDRLARLNVPGGVIRNIATHAAFLAADERRAVGMDHLLRAARVEYAKLERPLTTSEVGGWA